MRRRRGAGLAILIGWAGGAFAAAAVATAATSAKPSFSPAAGSYVPPIAVTLTTATAGATIYYTIDGSSPSRKTSPVYETPISLGGSATVKAFAYKKGLGASALASARYTALPPPPPPDETGGTLFLATLTPQAGATSAGSGAASLTLTQDQSTAVLRYTHAGLSGPLTSQHVHGPDSAVLFDLDTAAPQPDGSRVWRLQRAGTYDVAAIRVALRGGQCYLNLHTAAYPAGEIKGFFHLANGSRTFTPPPPPPALPVGPPTEPDAARFLLQATYGPRPLEVEALQQRGFASWLDEQMALPRASHLATYDQLVAQLAPDARPTPGLVRESLLAQAVTGSDQLRQRVTLALSELFVISDRDADVRNFPEGMAGYLDLLASHAFGNFRELLEAVTLAPSMGVYLDMAGSSRSIPELGRNPNENYAREILQLFTIGLYELHPDGTLRLDADNQPIPTYDQVVVMAMARAFTGWTFGGQDQRLAERFFRPKRNYRVPMEPWALYHATDEKRLLDGVTLPAGQTARADLEQALDVVFAHPNVGPFFCRFLIQRLVTSNPSPAYVYRCAQTFSDDGAGVRGNLATVVRAVLFDYEARATAVAARPDEGHLREPFVRLLGLVRAVDARPRSGRWRALARLDRASFAIGQTPLDAPTVFNFFEPGFALPGEIAQAGLVSPELQIATETTVVGAGNLQRALLFSNGPQGFVLDLTSFTPPRAPTDDAALDQVDRLLFGRGMSADTRAILLAALADPTFPRLAETRARTLLWLASLAPEAAVQK